MLNSAERAWLNDEAGVTLGLTPPRVRILLAVLDRDQFSLREIGRAAGQASEGVRQALDTLTARELIEFYPIGATRGRNAAYVAKPGKRLLLLLERLVPDETTRHVPTNVNVSGGGAESGTTTSSRTQRSSSRTRGGDGTKPS